MRHQIVSASLLLAAACSQGPGPEREFAQGASFETDDQPGATDERAGEASLVDPANAEVAEEEVLHRVDILGDELRFVRAESASGQSTLFLEFVGHLGGGDSVVRSFLAEHSELTLLEIYLALAPEGEPAHSALVDDHELQANLLQRQTSEPRHIEFEPTETVHKSAASCSTWVENTADNNLQTPLIPNSENIANRPSGGSLNLLCRRRQNRPACDLLSKGGQAIGVCVEGSAPVGIKAWWRYAGESWQKEPFFVSHQPGALWWRQFQPLQSVVSDGRVLGVEVLDPNVPNLAAYYVRAWESQPWP